MKTVMIPDFDVLRLLKWQNARIFKGLWVSHGICDFMFDIVFWDLIVVIIIVTAHYSIFG